MEPEVRIRIGVESSRVPVRAVKSNNNQLAMTRQGPGLWAKIKHWMGMIRPENNERSTAASENRTSKVK